MANVIGIIGQSGHGKTMSIVTPPDGILKKDEYDGLDLSKTILFNLDKKTPAFKVYKKFPVWKKAFGDFFEKRVLEPDKLEDMIKWLKGAVNKEDIKHIIIDTFSFGMFRYRMDSEHIRGFDRWTKLNIQFWNIIKTIQDIKNRDDLFIWIFFHPQETKDREGNTIYRARVEGNLLQERPEESLTNIFFATKDNNKYVFETQANQTTAKNPPLLFDDVIPNSLKLIENTLRN